jgi:hypothetical protein
MINWRGYLARYIYDEEMMPYRTAPDKMSRSQADNECFFYAFLTALLFAGITVTSLGGKAPFGASEPAAAYALSVVLAAVIFGVSKHVAAAFYCALVPLVVLTALFIFGFPPKLVLMDELLILGILLALLRYKMRLVQIARAYPNLPHREPSQPKPRRKIF